MSSEIRADMGLPPPSPLKFVREDSVDGTLSPVSSKSAGTDTEIDVRKKVRLYDICLFLGLFAQRILTLSETSNRPSLFHS